MRRSTRLPLLLLTAFLLWPGSPPAAVAGDVSADEFARLAADAAQSGSARDLATVTSIDGRPVDMAAILEGPRREQQRRLDSLSKITGGEQIRFDGDTLRNEADDITSQPPYTAEVASNGGVLDRIGRFLADVITSPAAGGLGLVVLVVIVLIAGYLVLDRIVNRRRGVITTEPAAEPTQVDYLARADAAAAAGDYAGAVRLLFVNGARHLEQLAVVRDAATTTTATVRPLTNDAGFLDRFDEIAYGGATANGNDVTGARRSWDALKSRLESR